MKRNRRRRAALLAFLLLVSLVALPIGLTWREMRQELLNHALIAALVKGDDRQALALVNAGADPDTRYEPTPVPSLLDLVKQMLHRSPPPVNDSETALSIA